MGSTISYSQIQLTHENVSDFPLGKLSRDDVYEVTPVNKIDLLLEELKDPFDIQYNIDSKKLIEVKDSFKILLSEIIKDSDINDSDIILFYNLGIKYFKDNKYHEAFKCFKKCRGLHSDGTYIFGYCLYHGIGCHIDRKQSELVINEAFKMNSPLAMTEIGRINNNDVLIKKAAILSNSCFVQLFEALRLEKIDENKAFLLLQKIKNDQEITIFLNCYRIAIYKLGKYYLKRENYYSAFDCFKESTELGYDKAKRYLAFCYTNGLGCKKDLLQQRYLF